MKDLILGALASVASIAQAVQGVLDASKQREFDKTTRELDGTIRAIGTELDIERTKNRESAEVIHQHAQKIREYEDWDRDAANYELRNIAPGVPVRILKDDSQSGNAQVWLCPNCFEHQKKSFLVLQSGKAMSRKCANCPFETPERVDHGAWSDVIQSMPRTRMF